MRLPEVKRHSALQDKRVVHKLMETHAELAMQQAVHQTALRFGISHEEVINALKGGDFFVKVK